MVSLHYYTSTPPHRLRGSRDRVLPQGNSTASPAGTASAIARASASTFARSSACMRRNEAKSGAQSRNFPVGTARRTALGLDEASGAV
jgi:hypothetical protein